MLVGKYINRYYLQFGIYFLIGLIALVVCDIFQLYIPEFLGDIVDLIDDGMNTQNIEKILELVIYTIVIAFVMFLSRVIWRLTLFKASTGIEADLRHKMFLKSERLSQTYYHNEKVGNILSWFTSDLESINEFFGWGTIMLVDALFMSLLVIVKMFILDWLITIVAIIPICLIFVWGMIVEKFMTLKWENRQKALDNVYDFSQESFTGIRVIKAFVKETQQLHAFAKIARKNQEVNVDFARFSVISDVCIQIIIAIITCIIIGVGGYLVLSAFQGNPVTIGDYAINLSNGDLITFVGYFESLVWPLIAFGQIFVMRSRAGASLKRITRFLDQDEDIQNPTNAITLKEPNGKITFKNFSFKYPNANIEALSDINLTINPGETIGIIGKIGSGKSTLVNSLLHLYNIEKGTIFIDDVDLMDLDLTSLRDTIAMVPQDNFLYSDTISSNIAFCDENLSMEKIIESAKFADVDDNIQGFPKGYETVSGERGVSLSGGQKQRISIARAYIKDAPIMILDDSVSAVDMKTEETILENIKNYRKDKTTILIASRVSTVMHLDKIIVLDDGKLEAFDSHENLMKTSPTYKRMVYLQELEKELGGTN